MTTRILAVVFGGDREGVGLLAAKGKNTLTGTRPQGDTSKLEEEIDELVYQLYGLTEEEIGIVEGK